jgi:hypothetical protein
MKGKRLVHMEALTDMKVMVEMTRNHVDKPQDKGYR